MKKIACPYCDCDISIDAIEAEDGCCPECGATIGASALFVDADADEDEYEDEYGMDDDFDDILD